MMQPPVKPSKEDCCNSGCNPCVFDVYEKQLSLYLKNLENKDDVSYKEKAENGISQLEYTSFLIVKKEYICTNHVLIHLKRVAPDNFNIWWRPGHHFLYKFKLPDKSCTRAYTPLKSDFFGAKNCDFSVIIKKYDDGLVSSVLFDLCEGDKTFWRGPYGHFELVPNKFDKIIMLAQGTGILPFISIIQNILDNEDDMTKILLLYCCKSAETILFREYFYESKSYWNFDYVIFLSDTIDKPICKYLEPLHLSKINYNYLNNLKPFAYTQFLLCGSALFMNQYKTYLLNDIPQSENIVLF